MAHTIHGKQRLLHRVRRIGGQVKALEQALEHERDCSEVLQLIAACRGAMNSLMVEVIEGHVHEHVLDPHRHLSSGQKKATQELLDVVKAYLK